MSASAEGFSDRTLRALDKWPNVPHLYGWLRLTRRGDWLLRGSIVQRPELQAVIARHYAFDERGCWYFQNGPQRGYVSLDYTPLVARVGEDGQLRLHTGAGVAQATAASLDEDGSLTLVTPPGPALLDDRDGDWALERLCRAGSQSPVDERALAEALARPSGSDSGLVLIGLGAPLTVTRIDAEALPGRYGFVREPQEDASGE